MSKLELALGVYDNPIEQIQDIYEVDIHRKNIAVIGNSLSGKTTFLKMLLLRIHQEALLNAKEKIYILDFRNTLFEVSKKLPYVKACFEGTNDESVRRLFGIIEEKLKTNSRKLEGQNYFEYSNQQTELIHSIFIINGIDTFFTEQRYEKFHDTYIKLTREGLSKGISLVFTANLATGRIANILPAFGSIISFDLPKDRYYDIYNSKVNKPIVTPGRGVVNFRTTILEFQSFFPYNTDEFDTEKEALEVFIGNMKNDMGSDYFECMEEKMKSFEGALTVGEWEKYSPKDVFDNNALVLGLDFARYEPVTLSLIDAQSIAIYGKKDFGKKNLLQLILNKLCKLDNEIQFVFWEDKRSKLASIIDKYSKRVKCKEIYNRNDFEGYIKSEYYDIPEDTRIKKSGDYKVSRNNKSDRDRMSEFNNSKNKRTSEINRLNEKVQGYQFENKSSLNEISDGERVSDLVENSYRYKKEISRTNKPFTVFIIQSKEYYQQAVGKETEQLINRMESFINNAVTENVLFIFSEVRKMSSKDMWTSFNNSINHAFLLDDIQKYMINKGRSSVFCDIDEDDIKDRFGDCERGDGFYYNVETDVLKKMKFLKCEGES